MIFGDERGRKSESGARGDLAAARLVKACPGPGVEKHSAY